MKCVKCPRVSTHEVASGLIRGLCSECTKDLNIKARRRGIYLEVRPGESPPFGQRERKVDGIALWWWDGSWRTP